jgi:peptide deformylase
VTVDSTGELARCLQHETDHLRGELFIDRLETAERRRVMRLINSDQIVASAALPGRATE